jgi:hypothetical protein
VSHLGQFDASHPLYSADPHESMSYFRRLFDARTPTKHETVIGWATFSAHHDIRLSHLNRECKRWRRHSIGGTTILKRCRRLPPPRPWRMREIEEKRDVYTQSGIFAIYFGCASHVINDIQRRKQACLPHIFFSLIFLRCGTDNSMSSSIN